VPVKVHAGPEFDERLAEWRATPSIDVAAELVATSVALGREAEALDAARILVRPRNGAMPLVQAMARNVLAGETQAPASKSRLAPGRIDVTVIYSHVSSLRSSLRQFPRNAFAWVDLARLYTVLGQLEPARRAIATGLSLSPDDRFVLRSASRFYLHYDDPEQALAQLQRSTATRHDPWLMAAEISFAQILERRSRIAANAKRRLTSGDWHPRSQSELQGALASLLMEDGSHRSARQLFEKSLTDPTENAVAQAQWATTRGVGLVVSKATLSGTEASEARALWARGAQSWADVISECWAWAEFEPTSVRSMIMGSYAAGVALQDASTMLEFTQRGLAAEPHNFLLRNNEIVALIYQGHLGNAHENIQHLVAETDRETVMVYALQGLYRFRSGDYIGGREEYEKAIAHPEAMRNKAIRSLALWHLAQEEALAETGRAAAAIARAEKASRGVNVPELSAMRDRLVAPNSGDSKPSESRTASLGIAIGIKNIVRKP